VHIGKWKIILKRRQSFEFQGSSVALYFLLLCNLFWRRKMTFGIPHPKATFKDSGGEVVRDLFLPCVTWKLYRKGY